MLRSYLLSIWFKSTSLVDWAECLRTDSFLAVLSGFTPGHTPTHTSFYDFFHRLWQGCKNFSPQLRFSRKKPPKGKHTGEKSPNFNKNRAAAIIKYFDEHAAGGFLKSKLYVIGEIFKRIFLKGSMDKQLLDISHLSLAGDGNPVKVSNRERSHSICDCHKDDPRLFCNPPRGSAKWKKIYNKRTSAERANKRIKIDGLPEERHHHSSIMWYIRLFAIVSRIQV